MRAVGHREIALVVSSDGLLTAQHEAGLDRVLPNLIRQDLIHANAAPEYRALHERHARENIAGLPRMDAHSHGGPVEETLDDVETAPEGRQRFEGLAQFHLSSGPLGPPVVPINSVSNKQGCEALWIGRRSSLPGRCGRAPDPDGF